jgi:serine/threonine protein kinase
MRRLFLAVNHMHASNICHRDIKPENVLFVDETEDSDIKLIDFGLSS